MKTCTRCNIEQPLENFYRHKESKNGYVTVCKACYRLHGIEYRKNNKEEIRKSKKEYSEKNKELISQKGKAYYANNKEMYAANAKIYRNNNKEKLSADSRRYSAEHSTEIVIRVKKWGAENPEKVALNKRNHKKKKLATTRGKLDAYLGGKLRRSLNTGRDMKSWRSLVEFGIDQLKAHFASLFTEGMTMELLTSGKIHIDHKIPISAFRYEGPDDEDFKKCWCLDNLQPLWPIDNLKKGRKIIK